MQSLIRRRLSAGCCLALMVWMSPQAGTAAPRRSQRSAIARQQAQLRQQRERTIAAVRKEVAAARQVLEQVQSKQAQSQGDLQAASAKLASARKETEAAEQADNDLHRRLREIEERVLSEQGADSEYERQLAAVDAARERLDGEMHRLLGLPNHPEASETETERMRELSALSEDERDRLNADAGYRSAREALLAAQRQLTAIEKSLLAADQEWQAAVEEHRLAEQAEREAKGTQRSSAGDVSESRQEMLSAQQLAARARSTIQNGEARLRQLGVQP